MRSKFRDTFCIICGKQTSRSFPSKIRQYCSHTCRGKGRNGNAKPIDHFYLSVSKPNYQNKRISRKQVRSSLTNKWTGESRAIAERVLQRPLRRAEHVHHINCDTLDNRNGNLLICSAAYHKYLHERMAELYGQSIHITQSKTIEGEVLQNVKE